MMEPKDVFVGLTLEDIVGIAWIYARAARARVEAGQLDAARDSVNAARSVIEHATARITRALARYGAEHAKRAGTILRAIGEVEEALFSIGFKMELRASNS